MHKCHVIIVDTVNSKKFYFKHVKNIIKEVLIPDSNVLSNKTSYLWDNIEFLEMDLNCDRVAIDKALLKEHLFINIFSSSHTESQEGIYNDSNGKADNQTCNSFSSRYHTLLRHAFISKNRNSVFLMLDEDVGENRCSGEYPLEISWMGIKTEICRDQLIQVRCKPRYDNSHEKQIKIWFLSKLMAIDGNFPFFCLPLLHQLMISSSAANRFIGIGGLVQLKPDPFVHWCHLNQLYDATITAKLVASLNMESSFCNKFTRPIFLCADESVDWRIVAKCIEDQYSSLTSTFIIQYPSRSSPIHQDINFLLVSLLKYFDISPKDNQLPFTTAQMATLVSDCLRSRTTVNKGNHLVIFIEDINWIASSCLTNEACSWLPEKCAPNIQVIISASKDSIHEKSLKCRLCSPIFIDVSYSSFVWQDLEQCDCHRAWFKLKSQSSASIMSEAIEQLNNYNERRFAIILLAIFMCSPICPLSRAHIDWVLSFNVPDGSQLDQVDSNDEKDQLEMSEKVIMSFNKDSRAPISDSDQLAIDAALDCLVRTDVIRKAHFTDTSGEQEHYWLRVPQLQQYINKYIFDRLMGSRDIELVKCRLAAYLVYETTDLHRQMLFVPNLLQYLSGVKDTILRDWLVNWPVLARLRDEFCVPVKLLSLWRALLGPNTDYRLMINAYIGYCLPDKRNTSDCPNCRQIINVELHEGPVSFNVLRSASLDYSRAYCKQRCRVFLDLARISMQVGQYAIAKDMARSLLKQLDKLYVERSIFAPFDSNRKLLASCLHLLFCTLDERLKTFEFVTEQTTPIFRRTVHYGARALLLQHDIVNRLQKCLQDSLATDKTDNSRQLGGLGDVRPLDSAKIKRELCQAEIRLAHIMTHFVFSLDGVEQTVINRHFMPSEIRCVTHGCMTRAHEIATRLKDRQLLLEIQMTFGVIQPRENFKEKILLYKTPLRQALCIYGEGHIFVSRLYINIGISYEEQKKYIKAFEYFTLWSHVTHELLGRNHCKSLRSCGVFKEPIFKVTAEFLEHINDEEHNESLDEELSECINSIDVDSLDMESGAMIGVGVTGISMGTNSQSMSGGMSVENMFMIRSNADHESDWEIHSSDDETPNYTTAFEEVIDKFKKHPSSTLAKELLQSILASSLIDMEDLSADDIDCLLRSQEAIGLGNGNNNGIDMDSTACGNDDTTSDTFRITRMFRDLRELAQWIPSSNLSPSDRSLSRRLLELQRELEEFLDN